MLKWFWAIVGPAVMFAIGGPLLALAAFTLVWLVNVLERERTRLWTWEEYRPGIAAEAEWPETEIVRRDN